MCVREVFQSLAKIDAKTLSQRRGHLDRTRLGIRFQDEVSCVANPNPGSCAHRSVHAKAVTSGHASDSCPKWNSINGSLDRHFSFPPYAFHIERNCNERNLAILAPWPKPRSKCFSLQAHDDLPCLVGAVPLALVLYPELTIEVVPCEVPLSVK